VEWLHWQGEVTVARTALRAEMADNNSRFYARRVAIAPCLNKMIDEAQGIIDGLETMGKIAPFTVFHLGQGTTLSDSEWQSERASQVLTHFPRAELALMNRYYALLPSIVAWIEAEQTAWAELSILQNPPARLEPSDSVRLRGQLDRTHRLNFLIVLNGTRMLKLSDQMGIVRSKLAEGPIKDFCDAGDDKSEPVFLKAALQP
jgi:hypothetical protein